MADEVEVGEAVAGRVLKADDEKRFLLTVAYAPNRIDPHVGADHHRDFATSPVVEKAAWRFMRKGAKLGVGHVAGKRPGRVVENYVYRGPDWVIKAANGASTVVYDGCWLVGMVLKQWAWDAYKAGDFGGVSVDGTALRTRPRRESLEMLRAS